MTDQTQPLNAAQVDMVNKAIAVAFAHSELRKWCLERAIEVYKAGDRENIIEGARAIFDFVAGHTQDKSPAK